MKKLWAGDITFKPKEEALKHDRSGRWWEHRGGREEYFVRYGIYGDIRFWTTMPLLNENTKDVFEWMCSKFDVFIATSASTNPEPSLVGKILSIKENFPFFDINRVFFIRFKKMLIGDYIIDDLPSVRDFQGKIVMMDYTYNRHVKAHYRVSNWTDIENLFKKIKAEK